MNGWPSRADWPLKGYIAGLLTNLLGLLPLHGLAILEYCSLMFEFLQHSPVLPQVTCPIQLQAMILMQSCSVHWVNVTQPAGLSMISDLR